METEVLDNLQNLWKHNCLTPTQLRLGVCVCVEGSVWNGSLEKKNKKITKKQPNEQYLNICGKNGIQEKVTYGIQCWEEQETFDYYGLYFYLLCQHSEERDFTSSSCNSFYKQILIYSIYSELFF